MLLTLEDLQGWADFKCPAHSVSVWAKKDSKARDEFNTRVE